MVIMKKNYYICPMMEIINFDTEQLLVVSTVIDGDAVDPARAPELPFVDEGMDFELLDV